MSGRKYSIVIYCPDTNLEFNGSTPDRIGIGGGKTVLVRIAKAFAQLGHKVTCLVNCDEPGLYSEVEYRSFKDATQIESDVLIALTSGGALDLSPLLHIPLACQLKIISVHGTCKPTGLENIAFDFIYVCSYFIKNVILKDWGVSENKICVFYNGVEESHFREAEQEKPLRDPFAVVFPSHPSKGLDVSFDLVHTLRKMDKRFYLDIYGGYKLHGISNLSIGESEGIAFKGLIGQKELAARLYQYGFYFALQEYQEPFGISVVEAKRAGVIVIASMVGAFRETISHGYDGFLIEDHYKAAESKEKALGLVEFIINNEEYGNYIRQNAIASSLSWEDVASAWTEHWATILDEQKNLKIIISGYYGFGNLGDEAILSCMIKDLKAVDPTAEIVVISSDPLETEQIHKVRAISRNDFKLQTKEVESSDLLVLGGGGLFQDHHRIEISQFFKDHRNGITSYANLPLMAKIYQKPLVYYAQGVGPLFSKESFLFSRWAFDLADFISVRDEYSYFLLTELLGIDPSKVNLSCDPVAKAEMPDVRRARALRITCGIPENKRLIIVSLRTWVNKTLEDKVVVSLSAALSSFLTAYPDYHVVFIPFQQVATGKDDDVSISAKVSETLSPDKYTLIKGSVGHKEIAAFYRCAEFSIGMRYHSLLLSYLAETPFLAISYDVKTDELLRELDLEEWSIDIRAISGSWLLTNMIKIKHSKHAHALEGIILDHPDARGLIVFKAIIDWKVPLFQRPQQLANAFAKKGFLVFYCTPNWKYDKYDSGFTAISDYMYIYHGDHEVFNYLDDYIVFINWNIDGALKPFKKAKVIYDYIDRIDLLSEYGDQVKADHLELIRDADVVSVTADDLFKDVAETRKDIILCPNGADVEHFRIEKPEIPEDIRSIVADKKPIIGYYGSLARWFDYELFKYVAGQRPGYNFLIVGYDYDGSIYEAGLESFVNILKIGPVPYGMLQNYLYFFDVATIPFKVDKITAATSPVKLFEYAAAGKPIVCTDLPECKKYEGVFTGNSREEFLSNIDRSLALRHDESHLNKMKILAEENSWGGRVDRFVSEFEKKGLLRKTSGQAQSSRSISMSILPKEAKRLAARDTSNNNLSSIIEKFIMKQGNLLGKGGKQC